MDKLIVMLLFAVAVLYFIVLPVLEPVLDAYLVLSRFAF